MFRRHALGLLIAGLCPFVAIYAATPVTAGPVSNTANDLIKAVQADDLPAVDSMLKKGADANSKEANGTTALHWAAYRHNSAMVKRLLAAGAKPNVTNEFGSNPMLEAAITGDAATIDALLKGGADPDSPNADGQTALMEVARTGNIEAAKALLKAGAHVNAVETFGGQTALMWAAAQSQPDMIRYLLEFGAKIDERGAVRDWQARITNEPRPKDRNHGGFTALLYAAREGCVECVKALAEGHADLNLSDPDRETPLNMALMNEHFDFAKAIVEAGADVDEWDIYGRSPLYNAVDLATLPTGGRPDVPSQDKTPAIEVVKLLLEKGADPNIQLSVRPPYRNVPQDRGGDQVLSTGATPLLRASKAGDQPETMKVLLAHGALVDLPTADGVTPLMAAAGMGHSQNPTRGRYQTDDDAAAALKILLGAGADIHKHADNGQTAMHAAAMKGWTKTVLVLAQNGADLELKDRQGKTPLDYASGNYVIRRGGGPQALVEPHPETEAAIKDLIAKKTASK